MVQVIYLVLVGEYQRAFLLDGLVAQQTELAGVVSFLGNVGRLLLRNHGFGKCFEQEGCSVALRTFAGYEDVAGY